uniref:Zgc:153044 n=1 Tax=Lepisosteus oculatus TaxID=7918 RepID=W5NNP8_LEPOC
VSWRALCMALHTPMNGNSVGSTAVSRRLSGLVQITDCLYLSNGSAANDIALVSACKITCIVSATRDAANTPCPSVKHVRVPVTDSPLSPLGDFFDTVADTIQQVGEQHGRTLVHCNAGVSRSAALCLAYLMKHRSMTLREAHTWVRTRRPIVRPNRGFWKQLISYEHKLYGSTTVKMVASSIGEIPDIYKEEVRDMIPY